MDQTHRWEIFQLCSSASTQPLHSLIYYNHHIRGRSLRSIQKRNRHSRFVWNVKNGVWSCGSRDNETKDKQEIAQVSRWYKSLQLQENSETSLWIQGLESNRIKHKEWRGWKWDFTSRKEDGWVRFCINVIRGNKMFLSKSGLEITQWIYCQPVQWKALG